MKVQERDQLTKQLGEQPKFGYQLRRQIRDQLHKQLGDRFNHRLYYRLKDQIYCQLRKLHV